MLRRFIREIFNFRTDWESRNPIWIFIKGGKRRLTWSGISIQEFLENTVKTNDGNIDEDRIRECCNDTLNQSTVTPLHVLYRDYFKSYQYNMSMTGFSRYLYARIQK